MFEIRVLKAISTPFAYEIADDKMTREICRIYHWLARFDAVEFNRMPDQTMKELSLIDFVLN